MGPAQTRIWTCLDQFKRFSDHGDNLRPEQVQSQGRGGMAEQDLHKSNIKTVIIGEGGHSGCHLISPRCPLICRFLICCVPKIDPRFRMRELQGP